MTHPCDALVLGAGINGLATAWQLLRRGVERVVVVEQNPLFHSRGSSHGHTRITRSSYGDPMWVELMLLAHGEEWPALEAEAQTPLRTHRAGCFWGPESGPMARWLDAVTRVGAPVRRLSVNEARGVFPAFRFEEDDLILRDESAAVIHAAQTLRALAGRVKALGGVIAEGVRVLDLEPRPGHTRVTTSSGVFEAGRVVVTAGPWTAKLLPGLQARLRVTRQSVGYLRFEGDTDGLPPWIWQGSGDDNNYYGLPSMGRPGAKVALHRTLGPADDPDDRYDAEPEVWAVMDWARQRFAWTLTGVVGSEACHYTNTHDEVFVLDAAPGLPGVVVGAGFSGHGFKFGPLTGRILAELVMDGVTTVAPFEAHRARFAASGRGG